MYMNMFNSNMALSHLNRCAPKKFPFQICLSNLPRVSGPECELRTHRQRDFFPEHGLRILGRLEPTKATPVHP